MRKKSIFALLFTAIFCFLFATCGLISNFSGNANSSLLAVSELFLPSEMSLTASTISEGGFTNDFGLLVSTNSSSSELKLKHPISGPFKFTAAPEMKEGSPVVKKMVVTFTDVVTLEKFDVEIRYSDKTNVSVNINGESVGLVYRDNALCGHTNIANLSGTYTTYSTLLAPISFDPESMCVYVGEGDSSVMVWSLTQSKIDDCTVSKTFSKFSSYEVSIRYTEFVGENAGVIFYSMCDNSLDKIVLSEKTKPQFFADFNQKGLINTSYVVPNAIAFDIFEGKISEVSVSVLNPSGAQISLENGCFTPTSAGNYSVIYSATNKFGVTESKEYIIEVLSELPDYEYSIDAELPEIVSVGETVYVPKMHLSGGLLLSGYNVAKVTVYRNGIKQSKYQNLVSGFNFTFENTGTYRFDYVVANNVISYTTKVQKADNSFVFDYNFGSIYAFNEYVDFSNAKLYIDSSEVAWTSTVTYPDGRVYSNKAFSLNQVGTYRVKISAKDENRSSVYTFSVLEQSKNVFSSTTDGATVSYGTSIFTNKSGVYVNTKTSATEIVYNQPIDISRYVDQTKPTNSSQTLFGEDKLYIADNAIPLISMSIEPNKFNSQVMRAFTVILTDAEDPTNQISVYIDSMNSASWSYIRAKAGSQGYAGWLETSNRLYTQDHGFLTSHSFKGICNEAYNASDSKIELYYDNEEKQILTYNGWDKNRKGGLHCIIADFDNPSLSNGLSWGGFTSNKVYLSIILGTVNSGNAGCYIYSVDGMDLTKETIDYSAPVIEVETIQSNGSSALEGLVGKTVNIPNVTAIDHLGNKIENVKYQVYFDDGNTSYNVAVTDGKFSTPRVGKYYIKYYVTDKFLNYAEKIIEVNVYQTADEVVANADVDQTFKTGKTGYTVTLFDKSMISVTNALNGYSISNVVKYGEDIVASDCTSFIPKKEGQYQVVYLVQDGVGRVTEFTYLVSVVLEEKPVVMSAIPHYVGFIRGNTYTLHDVFVVDYTSNDLSQKKAQIYINGVLCDTNEYKPEYVQPDAVDSSETIEYVTIEYKYNEILLEGLSFNVPVRNVYKNENKQVSIFEWDIITYFKLERYFLLDSGVTSNFNNATIYFTASNESEKTSKVSFIQSVNSDNIKFSFNMLSLESGLTNVKSFSIYLTDYADSSKVVKITIVKENGSQNLYICNSLTNGGFYGTLDNSTSDEFSFIFNNLSKVLFDVKNNRKVGDVLTYTNGNVFDGFSDKVYITFEIEKEDENEIAQFQLWNINGQNFADGTSDDTTAPVLKLNGKVSGNFKYSDFITIPSASASDVLSDVDYSSLKVTVVHVGINGESPVKDVNGLLLQDVSALNEYVIKLEELGEYKAYYTVRDSRKGVSPTTYLSFNSVMLSKPVITLNSKLPTSIKVGETVKIPKYSVTYNEDNENNLDYVIYIAPSDRYQYVDMSNGSFKTTEIGVYTIRYFALDSYGNYNILEHKITVTE